MKSSFECHSGKSAFFSHYVVMNMNRSRSSACLNIFPMTSHFSFNWHPGLLYWNTCPGPGPGPGPGPPPVPTDVPFCHFPIETYQTATPMLPLRPGHCRCHVTPVSVC